MNTPTISRPCPCGSIQSYFDCCGPFIDSDLVAETPEQLMRSRYTAFTQANLEYIQATMSGAALKNSDPEQSRAWAKSVEWLGLLVIDSQCKATQGLVEFKAYYRHQNKDGIIHERSLFERINGKWFYVGVAPHQSIEKTGRNEACPCGSTKKYKKCCLKQ